MTKIDKLEALARGVQQAQEEMLPKYLEKFNKMLTPNNVLKMIKVIKTANDSDFRQHHSDHCRYQYRDCTCGRKELIQAIESLEKE